MKVYILCKESDVSYSIDTIIKVFSNEIEAIKELYKRSYDGEKVDYNYIIHKKEIDIESESCESRLYTFSYYVRCVLTKEIWDRVIEELPENTTLDKLIKYDIEMLEYNRINESFAQDIVQNKYYSRFSIKEQLEEKMKELNIKVPELKL